MKITDLKPEIVWKFFHQVTQVPRPSKKEEKMILDHVFLVTLDV